MNKKLKKYAEKPKMTPLWSGNGKDDLSATFDHC